MAQQGWRWCLCWGAAGFLLLTGCGQRHDRSVLQEGYRTLKDGRYSQSVILFHKAIRDNLSQEDNALAFNGMGIAYGHLRQNDDAERMFEKASRINPGLVEPVYNLGALKYASGREAEAVICFEKAALIDSRETRPLEFLAAIYRQREQWDEARRVLAVAQLRDPLSPRVLTALALLEQRTNNAESAVALLQQALKHDARYAPAVFNLAMIERRQALHPGQARSYFKAYLDLVSQGPQADQARRALKEFPEEAPAAPPGVAASSSGPEHEPVAAAKPTPVTPLSAEEWMGISKKLERLGRQKAAFNTCLKAAREAEQADNGLLLKKALARVGDLCADDAHANYELGRYYAEHKQNELAVVRLKKAVAMSTNWFEAQFALAQAAQQIEEFDTARLMVKQAQQIQPNQAEDLWNMAVFCDRSSGLQDLAESFYAALVKQHPEDARAGAARERIAALSDSVSRPFGTASDSVDQGRRGAHTNLSWWGRLIR